MDELYTLENAKRFDWASISGDLHPERVAHLDAHVTGPRVLDAGCGGGAYVEYLARKGFEVTGCDKYDQFLDVARQRGRLGQYEQGDLTDLHFHDDSFDCAYCFDVLEHVDDRRALRELARVTRCRIILAVPKEVEVVEQYNLIFRHYLDHTHLRNYTHQSLRALIDSVPHRKATIFPELRVPLEAMARDLVRFPVSGTLGQLRAALHRMLFNKGLQRAAYADVYTGLVAVIDL